VPESDIPDGVDAPLADALVGVVDDIRRSVHGALGTRPWSVAVITRTWSGRTRGEGNYIDEELLLDPTPQVRRVTHDRMGPAGREQSGQVTLSQVSLRYSEAELAPRPAKNQEVAYRVRELHGQRQQDKWYVLAGGPIPRRGDKSGDQTDWYLLLEQTSAMGNLDGVDAP